MICLENPIRSAIRTIREYSPAGQVHAFAALVVESGGVWQVPDGAGYVELQLHEITGGGQTLQDAIQSWLRAAERKANILDRVIEARTAVQQPQLHTDAQLRDYCETLRTFGGPSDYAVAQLLEPLVAINRNPNMPVRGATAPS